MANEIKHTPAPWKVLDSSLNMIGAFLITSENYGAICKIPHDGKATDEHGANANLIAAAPELLEALKELHAVVMQSKDRTIFDNGENSFKVMKAAEAIAKAEGKQS